jgi:NAD(P)-dependent dehydrogenase (short-subunit alcohol dehydrogenase family)
VRYYQEGWFNLLEDRRTILITGDASGIGRATAELFAARGWFVGGFDVDSKGLATLRSSINDGIFEPLDVSDRAAVVRFGDQTDGRLDLLFNNAGINAKGAFSDMPWEAIARVVSVNFLGGMGLIQAALPLLAATANSGMAVYSATKHALKGLTEALSAEFAAAGIRAADLLPGIIDTGMLTQEDKARLPSTGMWRPLGRRCRGRMDSVSHGPPASLRAE